MAARMKIDSGSFEDKKDKDENMDPKGANPGVDNDTAAKGDIANDIRSRTRSDTQNTSIEDSSSNARTNDVTVQTTTNDKGQESTHIVDSDGGPNSKKSVTTLSGVSRAVSRSVDTTQYTSGSPSDSTPDDTYVQPNNTPADPENGKPNRPDKSPGGGGEFPGRGRSGFPGRGRSGFSGGGGMFTSPGGGSSDGVIGGLTTTQAAAAATGVAGLGALAYVFLL